MGLNFFSFFVPGAKFGKIFHLHFGVQKDRKTERQKDRKIERQRDRKTERQKDRETERHFGVQNNVMQETKTSNGSLTKQSSSF